MCGGGRRARSFALGMSPAPLIFGEEPHPLDNLLKLPASTVEALPPVLLQVGSNEVLRDEIVAFSQLLGPRAALEMYAGQVHVFQMFTDLEPAAKDALKAIGSFVRQCTVVDRVGVGAAAAPVGPRQ